MKIDKSRRTLQGAVYTVTNTTGAGVFDVEVRDEHGDRVIHEFGDFTPGQKESAEIPITLAFRTKQWSLCWVTVPGNPLEMQRFDR